MKKVNRKQEQELMIKRAKRAYRNFVAEYVVDHYLDDDENPVHGDDILDVFIQRQTGGKRGSGVIRALLQNDVNKALKEGLKIALKEGVPGVLVTQEYFDEDPKILDSVESWEQASTYVAGAGRGSETVGVMYIYSDEGNAFWQCAHNQRAATANGVIERVKSETEAGVKKKLPGYSKNSNFVKQITGNIGIPLIGN